MGVPLPPVPGVALFGLLLALTPLWRWLRHRGTRGRVVGIIPARYQSARFPGKPLAELCGKPMVLWTWEQACKARSLQAVVVATDDERIADVCRQAGARVVMTSPSCPNGTERCNEAVAVLGQRYDLVVNIQGDEPLIEPEVIDAVVAALQAAPDAVCSTACTPLAPDAAAHRSRVKCVLDARGYALYFSRGLLPHNKAGEPRPLPAPFEDRPPYLLHLGIMCYDCAFLAQYCAMAATPLMLAEDLEQLKVLENGRSIRVITVDHCAHGVDEPGDVALIEAKIRQLGLA